MQTLKARVAELEAQTGREDPENWVLEFVGPGANGPVVRRRLLLIVATGRLEPLPDDCDSMPD